MIMHTNNITSFKQKAQYLNTMLLTVTFSNTAHKQATTYQEAILSRLYSWLSSKGICVVSLPEVGKYPVSCCILNDAVSTREHRERNTETH